MYANLLAMSIEKIAKDDRFGNLYILTFTIDDKGKTVKLPGFYAREEEFKAIVTSFTDDTIQYLPVFQDGGYLLYGTLFQPHLNGFSMAEMSNYADVRYNAYERKQSGEFSQYSCEFPFYRIPVWFADILDDVCYPGLYELPESVINYLTESVKPKTEFNWVNCSPIENDDSFNYCVDRLQSIASNNSNGELVTISLYADGKQDGQPMFYFSIDSSTRGRVINGGIVYHASNPGYQLHT